MIQQPNDDPKTHPPCPPCPFHSSLTPASLPLPNYLLISDKSGFFQTPDHDHIMTCRLSITPDRPRFLLQSEDGKYLSLYLNDHVHVLPLNSAGYFDPITSSKPQTDSNPQNEPLNVPQLVEMTNSGFQLIIRTSTHLLSLDLPTQTILTNQ